MKGRIREGWYRPRDCSFPTFLLRLTRSAGVFVATPYSTTRVGSPDGCGGALKPGEWAKLEVCDPPPWWAEEALADDGADG